MGGVGSREGSEDRFSDKERGGPSRLHLDARQHRRLRRVVPRLPPVEVVVGRRHLGELKAHSSRRFLDVH